MLDLAVTNPTFTGSKSRVPTQKVLDRFGEGSNVSYKFGTEPLWKYGALAQIPSSGREMYPVPLPLG